MNRRELLASTGCLVLSAGCLRLTDPQTSTESSSSDTGGSSPTDSGTPAATPTETPRTATRTTEPTGTRTTTAPPSPTQSSDTGLDETYGGDVDDALWRVEQVMGGRYVAVGTTASGDGGGAWILETTEQGDVQWQRGLGGTSDAVFYSVIEDTGNDLVAAGTTGTGDDGDALLVKLDRGGNVLWERTQNSGQSFLDVVQTDDGGYVTVGTTDRNGTDGYLNKLTNDGEFVGENLYGGQDTPDRLLWCLEPSDGGLLLVGDTEADQLSKGWLVRTDRLGEVRWTRTFGESRQSYFSKAIEVSNGGYAVVGTRTASDSSGLQGWLARIDTDGSVRWQQGYSRNEIDILSGITESTSGQFVVAGTTGDAGNEQNRGWMMRVESRVGTPAGETTFDEYGKSALYDVETRDSETYLGVGYAQADGSDDDGWLTTVSTDRLTSDGFDGWMENANNYTGEALDRRGETETTVVVAQGADSNFAYDPAALRVDTGTTVTWEWSGEGGSHSVTHTDEAFGSPVQAQGSFAHSFGESGVYRYYCKPHVSLGMKGVVVVEDD